jgi:hypothetical protein
VVPSKKQDAPWQGNERGGRIRRREAGVSAVPVAAGRCLRAGAMPTEPIVLAATEVMSLDKHLSWWRDVGMGWPHSHTVRQHPERFQPPPANPNWGFDPEATYWFRLAFQNPSGAVASRILHIDFPLLDHVHVYAPDGKGGLQRMVTGDTEAWAGRPWSIRQLAVPLALPAGQSEVYIKVYSSSHLYLPTRLYQPDAFWVESGQREMLDGMFYGAILVLLGYNLFVYFTARERMFLFYVLALVPTVGYLLSADGSVVRHFSISWWHAEPSDIGVCGGGGYFLFALFSTVPRH